MVMSEIKDLNSSREVADLGGSGREFHRRMVSGKRELRCAFTWYRGTEKLLGCLEEQMVRDHRWGRGLGCS